MKPPTRSTPTWLRIAAIGAGLILPAIAARAARASAGRVYRMAYSQEPPRNPARTEVAWKEALIWAAVTGIVGAWARLVTRRSLPMLGLPAEGLDMEDEVEKID